MLNIAKNSGLKLPKRSKKKPINTLIGNLKTNLGEVNDVHLKLSDDRVECEIADKRFCIDKNCKIVGEIDDVNNVVGISDEGSEIAILNRIEFDNLQILKKPEEKMEKNLSDDSTDDEE
jgi:hypothetical protein